MGGKSLCIIEVGAGECRHSPSCGNSQQGEAQTSAHAIMRHQVTTPRQSELNPYRMAQIFAQILMAAHFSTGSAGMNNLNRVWQPPEVPGFRLSFAPAPV